MHGIGKLTWIEPGSSGKLMTIYKGDMFANVIQGRGKLTRSNGDVFDGEFENAMFNGEGIYKWSNPKLKFKG